MIHSDLKVGDEIVFLREFDSSPKDSIGTITVIAQDGKDSLWISYNNPDRDANYDNDPTNGGFRSILKSSTLNGYKMGKGFNYLLNVEEPIEESISVPEFLNNTKLKQFLQ